MFSIVGRALSTDVVQYSLAVASCKVTTGTYAALGLQALQSADSALRMRRKLTDALGGHVRVWDSTPHSVST